MEYYKAWRLCLYQDFSITTLLSPRGLKDDGEKKHCLSLCTHTMPWAGMPIGGLHLIFLQARCEIKKNRNAPIYITVHCELLLRSLAESNRSNWFCRPGTKPLIQVTVFVLWCKISIFISYLQLSAVIFRILGCFWLIIACEVRVIADFS